jgi:uncharacterized membrane protein
MNTTLLLEWVIKSAVILAFLLVGFAYLTLFERRCWRGCRSASARTAPDRGACSSR